MSTPEEVMKSFHFTKSPKFRTIYANWIQGAYGPFDISILVGETFAHPTQQFEVEQTARIVFNPIEAKLMTQILFGVVQSYEAQYGEIKIPDGISATIRPGGNQEVDSEGD